MKKNFRIILVIIIILFFSITLFLIFDNDQEKRVLKLEDNDELIFQAQARIISQSELDSVAEILAYLSANYRLDDQVNLVSRELEEIKDLELVSLADLAHLSASLLIDSGFEPAILRYDYDKTSNLLVIFRDGDVPKYLAFDLEGNLLFDSVWSLLDIIKAEETRLGLKVDRYVYFPAETKNFSQALEPFTWQYLN
ncbi:MAG: hypothetical protein EOM88_04065 [Clostridia bacterium]|nr:hypothetical protein [Clostridia bacterium]